MRSAVCSPERSSLWLCCRLVLPQDKIPGNLRRVWLAVNDLRDYLTKQNQAKFSDKPGEPSGGDKKDEKEGKASDAKSGAAAAAPDPSAEVRSFFSPVASLPVSISPCCRSQRLSS